MSFLWPIPGKTTQWKGGLFGVQRQGHMHKGLDFGGEGDIIYSVDNGIVTNIKWDGSGSGGWMIFIKHHDGWESRYMHLYPEMFVRKGNAVKQGQAIARVGKSGLKNTAAHLHFELLHYGQYVNPLDDGSGSDAGLAVAFLIGALLTFLWR